MENPVKAILVKLLGLERINERLVTLESHFVTRHNPETGAPVETLADRQADKDGRPRPKPLPRGRSWDQKRRFLEAQNAEPKPRPRIVNE